ncbi:MAG: exo-alpha-sialidase, partial [Anaerohalosphaera sp.]|nr:exo-alpha-sialidase [Anaerohalosphaera sp.]
GRPDNWVSPGIQEVPTIHRVVDPQGKRRLIVFTGLYPCRMAVSEDDGNTWSPFAPVGDWGGIVTMGCMERLKDGRYMAMFHDDGRFFAAGGSRTSTFTLYKTFSDDGGLTWSFPEVVIECDWAGPCEPGIVRSPDGDQLAVLMRENTRRYNSLLMLSDDEGQTWSDLIELPASLTGDRHTGQYTPDGRLFISFRDRTHESPTSGDWVGWVGTYDDIVNLHQGQYRVRVKDNLVGADTAYPGVEILPNGKIVTTTYGHWEPDVEPYIVSSRFRLSEIDAENVIQNEGADIDYCGQAGTIYLAGDINHDCYVDLADMTEIASVWLECTAPDNEQDCVVQW